MLGGYENGHQTSIKVVEVIWGCLPKHQHIFNDIIKRFLLVTSSCLSCKQTFLQVEYNK
jgi:hypothetical protein